MLWPNFQDTQQGTKNAKDDANTTNMYYDKDITFLSLKKSCTYTQMFCESKDNCGVAGGQKRKKKTKGKIVIIVYQRIEMSWVVDLSCDMSKQTHSN